MTENTTPPLTHPLRKCNLLTIHDVQVPVLAGSALGRIPDDIIYQLYQFLQSADPIESLHTTVTLSHVCGRWRTVAVHAPLLWTYVRLCWTQKRMNHSQVVDEFLRRSRHLPLTIHLVFDLHVDQYIYDWANALSAHAHRFRELAIVVDSSIPPEMAIEAILPLEMPRLQHFNFALLGNARCTVAMKPRPSEQVARVDAHLIIPKSPFSYLDWTARNFHLTSISLKYLDLSMVDLFPVLVLAQSTITHLEYYIVTMDDNILPRITLPKLTSLHIGYTWAQSAWNLLDCLICPSLSTVQVHDFGRCPETRTPVEMRDDTAYATSTASSDSNIDINSDTHFTPDPNSEWATNKDARELLTALCPFTSITSLTLRGVTCFFSTFEDVTPPLEHLFRGLTALVLVQCDSQFFHALFDITLDSTPTDLEALTQLVITSDDYPLVLDYLRLRAARGLPKLGLFSVNPRMAVLRHFYGEFAEDFQVRGQVRHQPKREALAVHPYPCEARAPRLVGSAGDA
ncbi:hypothetical protein DXG03_006498 [Asterophora parasitica]|uniref:F-box domain-containing protein n=1 Tax=Asterophora parasitica TaxID=117018 RepID=A0A9P7G7I8_9AGAR|nr:hypothetical protein DXG03_006498 [Asterophora parasitica]